MKLVLTGFSAMRNK